MLTLTAVSLLALAPWACGATQDSDAPRSLHIVAAIDGVDDLHLNANEARWIHREYQLPESVSINGRAWDVRKNLHWVVDDSAPFLAEDVDLAGATVTLVRGRGEIDFRHGADGLILSFDDSRGGGADEFEVLVEFADETCASGARVGDPEAVILEHPNELLIEARIDGRDELQLSPKRADWIHQAWSWPTAVEIGGHAWDPEAAPLNAPPGTLFFARNIDLDGVIMEIEAGRGTVELAASAERLLLRFDDDADFGADDYVVRLRFPEPLVESRPRLPSGPALRVQLEHRPAADVAGARLTVLALSPASGEYIPWSGLRGMDASGRCVVALPLGTYRFEVLHRAAADRLVALRTGPIRLTDARSLSFGATVLDALVWRNGEERFELRELALQSLLGDGEVSWSRASGGADLELVVSPRERFSLRVLGAGEDTAAAWWTELSFGEEALLDSTEQVWIQCGFEGHAGAPLPTDCHGTLLSPKSAFSFPIGARTRLLTNRRFVGFSYRYALADGGLAVFHQQQVLLPKTGERYSLQLGGEVSARGSAAILPNENLGSPSDEELWWELVLVDPEGRVLDTAASAIEWSAEAQLSDGSPVPQAPLDDESLAFLGDPTASIALLASYRWSGPREVRVDPAPLVVFENELYRSLIPGHLDARARAYLDKASRVYRAIESVRGKPGDHTVPIELRWWLNNGAVGAWGSITMPILGMTEDFGWYSMPWALAHESLHAFGYPHGPELERIDRAVIRMFERKAWEVEFDPTFTPARW